MSGHLIGCVKHLTDLPPRHKLALVAFADSADDRTHIGFPGYEGVQEWAGCGRSTASDLIRDLVTWGLLRPHKRGHRGQRAEYVVFPGGCCDLHRTPVAEPEVDVDAIAQAAGISVDQARLMLSALGTTPPPGKGSTLSGPNQAGKGPDRPDPIGGSSTSGDDPVDDELAGKGPEGPMGPESVRRSRSNGDTFTPSKNPLTPAEAGGRCSAHPNGRANCRRCGTTPRQLAAAEKRAADEQRRAAQAAEVAAARAARLAGPPEVPAELRKAVRAEIQPFRGPK